MTSNRTLSDNQIEELCNHLRGGCGTLEGALFALYGIDDEDDLTNDDGLAFDDKIFCCDTCGWWCDNEEMHVTDAACFCDDCADDDGEDE